MRIVFAGTTEFAARAFDALLEAGHQIPLVLTQPDRPAGRGMHPSASDVKRRALDRGLELHQPVSFKEPGALAPIAAARPEMLVVAAYGLILPQAVLDSARFGALNIHASLLPRWRGAAPIQRALLAGDRETGITIIKMDAGLDTGPMLAQGVVSISDTDDAGTLQGRLAALGARMIVETVAKFATGGVRATPQPAEGVSYAAKIEKRESVLDWTRSASELSRVVRAFRPSPGAATFLGGEALKIWRGQPVEGSGLPGKVLVADSLGIVIGCGEGALQVTELQRAGGRRLSAAEFLRGRSLEPGARFGPLPRET
ncbi:MAG TPA: methionyl-tRNA formyltransferase [Burkholderiales bacterium]|nr:methionyl-tRNA formyltransferase [Burkholderiales bacterium]